MSEVRAGTTITSVAASPVGGRMLWISLFANWKVEIFVSAPRRWSVGHRQGGTYASKRAGDGLKVQN